jgi:type 1 glutamine amidotransferase
MSAQVLVICGDQYHSSDDVMNGLNAIFEGEVEFHQAPFGDLDNLTNEFSAIVLAKLNVRSENDQRPWTTPANDDRIGELVADGLGLLVVHAGTVGYEKSNAIRSMTGGVFVRHPEPCGITFEPVGDFLSNSVQASFSLWDEHYFVNIDPTTSVFLEATSEHGRQPAAWFHQYGQGQVCVLTPGHFSSVWLDSEFQKLVRFALESVMTKESGRLS